MSWLLRYRIAEYNRAVQGEIPLWAYFVAAGITIGLSVMVWLVLP
jgi:hypothetical protein